MALITARNQLLDKASNDKLLANVRPNGREDARRFRLNLDAQKASAFGLTMADVDNTLSVAWGGRYIDDFIDRGRVKRVIVQADAPFRMVPEDFNRWTVLGTSLEVIGHRAVEHW
jgi:multidrug efflux pump